jgi:hypothetical protein
MPVGSYSPDVLTRIFNVHWMGGLAVIFGAMDEDAPDQGSAAVSEEVTVERIEGCCHVE